MILEINEVKDKGILLKVENDRVYIIGNIESRQPGDFMTHFFSELHNMLVDKAIGLIEVDITQLKFLNSSGIKELAKWIMNLNSLPDEKKYKIKFICDKNLVWQDTSIATLTFLNPENILKEFIN